MKEQTDTYLLYTIVTQWDEPPRARHQITNELKKDGIVYFVEKNKTGKPRIEIKKIEENLFIITPYFPIDYRIRYRVPFINEIYHKWLLKKINSLKVKFKMVITFDYTAPLIHLFFDNVIFYCADDNVGFGKFNPAWVNNYHTKTEKKVAEKAAICIVTSNYMHQKISAYNPRTYNIPLGAPEIHLKEVFIRDKENTLPVLGLVGYLDSNLDEQLLFKLLEKFKIIFIGPASNTTKEKILKYKNATFLGPKVGDDLYNTLQKEVDVCIAPYDLMKINKGATPNKLWLYLAVGRPSVVTKIPNIDNWQFEDNVLFICENKDFEQNCILAYRNDSIALTNKRIEIAKNSSWGMRIKEVKELYEVSRS